MYPSLSQYWPLFQEICSATNAWAAFTVSVQKASARESLQSSVMRAQIRTKILTCNTVTCPDYTNSGFKTLALISTRINSFCKLETLSLSSFSDWAPVNSVYNTEKVLN